jgi:hypothetical protein
MRVFNIQLALSRENPGTVTVIQFQINKPTAKTNMKVEG